MGLARLGGQRLRAGTPALTRRQGGRGAAPGRGAAEARLRPGRQSVQREYRRTQANDRSDVLFLLEDVGVNRGSVLHVYAKAAEYRLWNDLPELEADDVQGVCDYLLEIGVDEERLPDVLIEHPPIVAYDVDTRLKPVFEYLSSLGVEPERFGDVVMRRPSLLGLDVEANMKKMVDYLLSSGEYTHDEVVEFLLTTL